MKPQTTRRVLAAGILVAYAIGSLSATTAPSAADKAVLTLSPSATITSSLPSPMPGFRQVVADGQVLFASDDGRFVVQGQVFDLTHNKELTEAAMASVRVGVLEGASSTDMIVFSPAKPKYTVTVFTDPTCGYCRIMHQNIQSYLDAGIAIQYLPFPRSGPTGPGADASRAVWCAPDRKAALSAAFNGTAPRPAVAGRCAAIVGAGYALGTRLAIPGTPAVIAANGDLLGGMVTAPKMLAALEAIAARDAK